MAEPRQVGKLRHGGVSKAGQEGDLTEVLKQGSRRGVLPHHPPFLSTLWLGQGEPFEME
jgi:hypothetical protein